MCTVRMLSKTTQITQDIKYVYLFSFVRCICACVLVSSLFKTLSGMFSQLYERRNMMKRRNDIENQRSKRQSHGIKNSISTRFQVDILMKYFFDTVPSICWIQPTTVDPSTDNDRDWWCTLLLIHVCIFYNCQWWSTLSQPAQSHSFILFSTSPATNQPIITVNSYATQET